MLVIRQPKNTRLKNTIILFIASILTFGGFYLLSLTIAPTVAPIISNKTINVKELKKPDINENRIIIPKIGINIKYAPGEESLDRGAQWRYPERGNPEIGGNFIIAAHRFSIQPTPQGTIEKSPFYHIDKLENGDNILIDFNGKRYAYEINEKTDVNPNQIEIEDPSETAKLTIYSCELGGAKSGRIVIVAKLLGQVNTTSNS